MEPNENCATCHPELLENDTHPHQTKKRFSFDTFLPFLLGILVIVSLAQTAELRDLKKEMAASATVLPQNTATAPAQSTTPQQPANPYQSLPSQVGGC